MKSKISKLKTAVLMGGIGEERDISIQSGKCVTDALQKAGVNVVPADITPDNMDIIEDRSIDVFFIALHGRFGEDGQLQQILQDKSLTYTGSGPQASRLAFDKMAGKERFCRAGVATPKAVMFDPQANPQQLAKELLQIGGRYVVKPVRQGSTIGVAIADDSASALKAARLCFERFGNCMIEEFIPGREITVGILANQALPVIEIVTKTGFYDYNAKYLDNRTEFLFDTIEEPLAKEIQSAALDCFGALGCRGFARVDFRLDEDRKPYVLETNTIPGLTTHSLLPKAAANAGISMNDLCLRIIDAACPSPVARRS